MLYEVITYDLLSFQVQASELAVAGDVARGNISYILVYRSDSDDGQPGEAITDTLSASLDGRFRYGDGGWRFAGANLIISQGQGNLAVAVPPGNRDAAASVLAAIEEQYQLISALLGIEDDSQETVYLYPNPESLRADVDLSLPGPTPSWVEPGQVRLLYSDEITVITSYSIHYTKLYDAFKPVP